MLYEMLCRVFHITGERTLPWCPTKWMANNETMMLLWMQFDVNAAAYIGLELLDNDKFVMKAVSVHAHALRYASLRLRKDPEVLKAVLDKDPGALALARDALQDFDIAKVLIHHNTEAFGPEVFDLFALSWTIRSLTSLVEPVMAKVPEGTKKYVYDTYIRQNLRVSIDAPVDTCQAYRWYEQVSRGSD